MRNATTTDVSMILPRWENTTQHVCACQHKQVGLRCVSVTAARSESYDQPHHPPTSASRPPGRHVHDSTRQSVATKPPKKVSYCHLFSSCSRSASSWKWPFSTIRSASSITSIRTSSTLHRCGSPCTRKTISSSFFCIHFSGGRPQRESILLLEISE